MRACEATGPLADVGGGGGSPPVAWAAANNAEMDDMASPPLLPADADVVVVGISRPTARAASIKVDVVDTGGGGCFPALA